jgi:hypothetical protein
MSSGGLTNATVDHRLTHLRLITDLEVEPRPHIVTDDSLGSKYCSAQVETKTASITNKSTTRSMLSAEYYNTLLFFGVQGFDSLKIRESPKYATALSKLRLLNSNSEKMPSQCHV